ncbi:hypothetical protein TDB9533_00569 [Thalassocella blandensis]|nr:hypothetical protein TDB9533_00569 [Thalassocella blandensis]
MAQKVFQPFTSEINVKRASSRRIEMSQAELAQLFGKTTSVTSQNAHTAFTSRLSGWQEFMRSQ